MKIIEGMKKIKDLQRKADDLQRKVKENCALLSFETPPYGKDQQLQVAKWSQAHGDILQEILDIRLRIQSTNLCTPVTINIGEQHVTKSIAAWIHRRRDLANKQCEMYMSLTDRGLKEGALPSSTKDGESKEVKIVRFFDPASRDKMIDIYRSEPSLIDATLEVVNATTDLIEQV